MLNVDKGPENKNTVVSYGDVSLRHMTITSSVVKINKFLMEYSCE